MVPSPAGQDDGESRLTFTVGGEVLAVPSAEVAEITRVPRCTRVPNGPPSLVGVANLRGSVLPVVSLAALLGHPRKDADGAARIVVLAGVSPVGLLVDRVSALGTGGGGRLLDTGALLERDFGALRRSGSASHAERRVESAPGTASGAAARDSVALIGLVVGGQGYALALHAVTEIMRLPATFATVPRTDDAMIGVIPYRGGVLPLVALAVLLGLPHATGSTSAARIVVATVAGARAGLVVDGVAGTLDVARSAIDPVPPVLMRGAGEASLDGICRLDGGRLVGLLAADRLFDAQTLHRIRQAGVEDSSAVEDGSITAGTEQFLLFQLGGEQYGLPIAAVDEVVRPQAALTRLPKAPDFLLGVMSLRGRAVPVIDMARRFGVAGQRALGRVIVVSLGTLQAGLAVDSVSDVLSVAASALHPAPAFDAATSALFDRIALRHEGRMVLLISPAGVLLQAEHDLLAEFASQAPAVA